MTPSRTVSRLVRLALTGLAAMSLGAGAAAGAPAPAVTGFAAPVITAFSARLAPCPESDFRCTDVSWSASDRDSRQLLYDLIVERADGRVTYSGGGDFRPGRPLRASLVPRGRPVCGTYVLTLTVTNEAEILTARSRTVTRRANCTAADPRRK
jgi:hypothetical protein